MGMAFEDKDFISKEKHELDYVLRKWNKRTTQSNRDLLIQALDAFNADASLEPHKREQFYGYAASTGLKNRLESGKSEEAAVAAAASASSAERDTDKKRKIPWWWILIAILLVVVVLLLLRSCGGCSPAASAAKDPAPASEPIMAAAEVPAAPVLSAAPEPKRLSMAGLSAAGLPPASLSIRFLPDSATGLAAGEEIKLQAIAAALKAFDSGELVVVGHSWRVGYPEGERAVAESRARYIAKRLAESGIASAIAIETAGQGAAAPRGDAASSRRVEISAR